MNPDDLQKELDGLWEKVTSGVPRPEESSFSAFSPSAISDAASITREVSLETISLLKRQHRTQTTQLQELLESKERTLRGVRERLSAAENELSSLRRRLQREDALAVQQVFEMSGRLEEAQKALVSREELFREEERVLRALAEGTRSQLAAEISRFREVERQWAEREGQYLLDIKELESIARRSQEESGKQESRARKSVDELKGAKNAVEKTLAELLQERQLRDGADKERDKAIEKVREVEDHFQQLQNIWQEERKQWQELWDRERSTWESKRGELSAWEEKLRKEREEWHGNLRQLEEKETRYAGEMAEILRKSSEAGEKVAGFLRAASDRPAPAVSVFASTRFPLRRAFYAAAAAAALALCFGVYRYTQRLRLEPLASTPVSSENPTGMAFDGSTLWVCDWNGDFFSLSPEDPSRVLRTVKAAPSGAYHPVALAVWGESLYSIDSAQARVLRHQSDDPSKVKAVWPAPGPAPTALAHDGRNLWSYDAVTRSIYRHLGEGAEGGTEAYPFPDALPAAMAWYKDELWVSDPKSARLAVFRINGRALEPVRSEKRVESFTGMALGMKGLSEGTRRLELLALSPGSSGVAMRRYRVRPSR